MGMLETEKRNISMKKIFFSADGNDMTQLHSGFCIRPKSWQAK